MKKIKYPRKHARKEPCNICNVKTGSPHKKGCKWRWEKRGGNKKRMSLWYAIKSLIK